jgi:hypothetical protein
MKQSILKVSLFIAFSSAIVFSCKPKDEVAPDEPATTTGNTTGSTTGSSNTTPGTTIPGADGAYIGLKNLVVSNYSLSGFPINTTIYTESGVASINTSSTSTTLVDGGVVKINDSSLVKQSNNAYFFTKNNPNTTSSFTNFFGSGSKWNVAGNSANGVPAFTYTATQFPTLPALNLSNNTINKNAAYAVNLGSITTACDSVIFQLVGGGSTKLTSASKSGSTTMYTFSATEMATLQASSTTSGIPAGQLSVFAYKYYNTTISGKKYWFVNVSAKTILVNVQ